MRRVGIGDVHGNGQIEAAGLFIRGPSARGCWSLTGRRVPYQRMGSLSALSNASQPVVMPGTNAWQPSASSTSLPSGSL